MIDPVLTSVGVSIVVSSALNFVVNRLIKKNLKRLEADLLDVAEEAIGRGVPPLVVLLSLRRGLGIPTRGARILEKNHG